MDRLSPQERKRIQRHLRREPRCCLCGQPGWQVALWIHPNHPERHGHCYSLCYSCSIRDHREELNARSARLDAHLDLEEKKDALSR